jgi:hypothetical protein
VPDVKNSLERLAERGSPRGAYDVFLAATRAQRRAEERWSTPVIAVGSAIVVFALFGFMIVLRSGADPDRPTGPAPAPGTITLVLREWEGMVGYEVLTVVIDTDGSRDDSPIVGAAGYGIIGTDPFSLTEVAHPPILGADAEGTTWPDWATDDYVWDETAIFGPGEYRVEIVANPGQLTPYGSHVPATGAERRCVAIVEMAEGSAVVIEFSTPPVDTPFADVTSCARVVNGATP